MMKLILSVSSILMVVTLQFANASEAPRVAFYLSCQEVGAPMFDAVVVNVDEYTTSNGSQLKASVYHRVEQDTVLVTRVNVREQQARRPGAPKEYVGKGVYLSVKTTATPSKKGHPATFELRGDQTSAKMDMFCQYIR